MEHMKTTEFAINVEIDAPPSQVWPVMADVERWPEWTPSVRRIVRLTPGPLQSGSRVRIHQPKFPPAWWRVTAFEPGRSFTWVSVAPGLRVTARHDVEAAPGGSRVTLSIRYEGQFGPWFADRTRSLNERYLAMEALGLKARCTAPASSPAPLTESP